MNLKFSKSFSFAAIMLAVCLTLFIGAATSNVLAQDDSAKKARTVELQAAVGNNQPAEVRRLLDAGYEVDGKSAGNTALHIAVVYKRVEIVKLLLERGANPLIKDEDAYTPGYTGLNSLQLAEKGGNREIINLIKQAMDASSSAATADDKEDVKTTTTSVRPANDVKLNLPRPTATVVSTADGWEKPERFKVGEIVLFSRDRGKTWQHGTVKDIKTLEHVPRLKDVPYYIIEDERKITADYYDSAYVTTLERQNYWTEFFVGDWNLTLPLTMTTEVRGNDVYRVFAGADRLPPLRVNADGSYSWVIDKNKVIRGLWKANENGPGLILLKGDRGDNWILYNTSDASERESFKTNSVRLVSESGNYSPLHGFYIQKK